MADSYWDVNNSDTLFYKRFLENRLPNRIVDGRVYLNCSSPVDNYSSTYPNEEIMKQYALQVFPESKYDYIAFPAIGKGAKINEVKESLSLLRTRSVVSLHSDWSRDYCEEIIMSGGLCGFSTYYSEDLNKNAPLQPCLVPKQLSLINTYEKALNIQFPYKQPISALQVRELLDIHKKYPKIKIVIGGFGGSRNVSELKDLLRLFGRDLHAFYFDTVSVDSYDLYDVALSTLGSNRILYGSGIPYCLERETAAMADHNTSIGCTTFLYKQLKELLDSIGNDEEAKRKIFYENAEKVYTVTQKSQTVGGKRVTLKEVAKSSGYSLRTVKKVMGGREYVSEKVKDKILETGKELGYEKNKLASALAKNQTHKIAVIYTETSKYFFDEIRTGFEKCIKDYQDFGIEVEFYVNKESKTDQSQLQSNLLKGLNLRSEIEGVIIHPFNSPGLVYEINALEESGKPVITFVSDTPDSNRMCYVGSEGRKSGRIAAGLMGKFIYEEGTVCILRTLASHWQSVNREDGFIEKMKECFPKVKLIEHDCGRLLTDEEYSSFVGEILRKNNIDGIFATSANVYLVGKLLKEMGRTDIKVIGYDLSEETRQLLKDDFIDVVMFQNPEEEAYESLKIMCDYILEGVRPDFSTQLKDVSIITGDSL